MLFLDRPLPRNVVTYMGDPRSGGSFWFALDGARKVPEMVPSGKAVLTLWTQYPHAAALAAMSDAEITDQALRELPLLAPGVSCDWVEHARVQWHEFSHPPYVPDAYRAVVDFKRAAGSLRGVSFVSDVFGGAYMESSLRSAAAAVRRIQGQVL